MELLKRLWRTVRVNDPWSDYHNHLQEKKWSDAKKRRTASAKREDAFYKKQKEDRKAFKEKQLKEWYTFNKENTQ